MQGRRSTEGLQNPGAAARGLFSQVRVIGWVYDAKNVIRPRSSIWLGPLLVAATLVKAACGQETGIIELQWTVVDEEGRLLYPNGSEKDLCRIAAINTAGQLTTVRLQPELRLYNCEENQEPSACLELEPSMVERLPCARSRDALLDVPIGIPSFIVDVVVLATPPSEVAVELPAHCLARPGPRRVHVSQGHVTDLAVYRFRLAASSGQPLDLRVCN